MGLYDVSRCRAPHEIYFYLIYKNISPLVRAQNNSELSLGSNLSNNRQPIRTIYAKICNIAITIRSWRVRTMIAGKPKKVKACVYDFTGMDPGLYKIRLRHCEIVSIDKVSEIQPVHDAKRTDADSGNIPRL